jgi:serine/threonine protein kinase
VKKPIPFGKYYLLERINVGGMAEVFRSKAYGVEGFERLVAVKRILPNIAEDKEFIKMFIDEAKIAVQLNHANIAQIFDLGVVDGSYYIALEHVHGRDLRAIFDRCRTLGEPMPVAQACFVVMKVCEGLDYAHNKRDQAGKELNLVHRDVSPQNVLVSFEGEVKLIDFGIAKAAGKGAKTQAGILKGKFGYMSPEQVRGLPVDRRSDIFSCGIVLYELLTGERLFVGESDFSTLEKVRNVEILPPSTYNRKIPDELERIVLKALAKDVEDRYQNSIDLHDELQAFVYTAGEFYSRKDLAGWMKRTFAKEIDEETAKLESYRQLKPPSEQTPAPAPTGAKGTQPLPPAGTKPPPINPAARRTAAMGAVTGSGGAPGTKPPPPPSVRTSQQLPIIAPAPTPVPPGMVAGAPKIQTRGEDDLAWDDDELETQIYDDPPAPGDDGKLRRPTKTGVAIPAPGATLDGVTAQPAEPDLSSLVTTAKGWESPPGTGGPGGPGPGHSGNTRPPPATTLTGMGALPPPTNGAHAGSNGRAQTPTPGMPMGMEAPPPVGFATGSNKAPSPYGAPSRESAAVANMVDASEPTFDAFGQASTTFGPSSSFGSSMLGARQKSSKTMYIIVAAAVLLAGAGITVAVVLSRGDDTTAKKGDGQPTAASQDTGFDLYVTPSTVTRWRLDDELRTDKLPSRIRGISPGPHKVSIEAPPGFMSESQQIDVKAGLAPRIDITLDPMEITGKFDSTPPGAEVFLLVDGERRALGPAPATAKLDPRKTYQVLFEKPGYVSKNMPVALSGAGEETVSAVLDKADAVAVNPPGNDAGTKPPGGGTKPPGGGSRVKPPGGGDGGGTKPPGGGDGGGTKPPGGDGGGTKPPGGDGGDGGTKPAGGDGVLAIASKPPCDIFVDSKDTGLKTPQREMKLSAGKHKITLVNNEFSIKETFWVEVKANETVKASKNFMDKLEGGGGGGGGATPETPTP